MSCNGCTKSFGFFTKELGCPGCNFSYCSKCLKKNIEVPRLNNKKHKVCLTCHDRIVNERQASTAPSPDIETLKSTVSAIDQPLPAECTVLPTIGDMPTSNDPGPSDHITVDESIKQRLDKLKEDRLLNQPLAVTDKDIAIRVANLKGERFVESSNDRSILLAVDNRSDQEKSNDLVAQYMSEAKIDEDADPIKDIERRLAALKDNSLSKTSTHDGIVKSVNEKVDSDSENDDDQVKRLVGRYLEEAALEPVSDGTTELTAEEREFVESVPKAPDQEELPWCVICNEDATIRYQGDLFCRQCYREVREDE